MRFIVFVVFVFSGFAFASSTGDLAGSSVSVVSGVKDAFVELGKQLIPVFVLAGAGIFTIKRLIFRFLVFFSDRRMKSEGYEIVEPRDVYRMGRHYRKRIDRGDGRGSVGGR